MSEFEMMITYHLANCCAILHSIYLQKSNRQLTYTLPCWQGDPNSNYEALSQLPPCHCCHLLRWCLKLG